MRVALASDHAGFHLKEKAARFLVEEGHEVLDLGTHDTAPADYPDQALEVGRALREGKADRGILICGSGVGVSVAANKIP
ncbi:MAG: RpiB/LacA/LacB family sugar-phosphate isomerase, partial [bacterium]